MEGENMDQKELERMIVAQEKRVNLEKDELWELQKSLIPFTIATKSKDIGRCFKSRNNYSCPEEDGDFWWVYYRVIDVNQEGYYSCVYFQTDKYGRLEASVDFRNYIYEDWEEITKNEYDVAVEKHISSVEKMLK